jgi:hypothetical protein
VNDWIRRNFFSLTGIYYNLFGYGESLKRIALTTVGLFAIFSLTYFIMDLISVNHATASKDLPVNNTDLFKNGVDIFVKSASTTLEDMFQIKSSSLQPLVTLLEYFLYLSSVLS